MKKKMKYIVPLNIVQKMQVGLQKLVDLQTNVKVLMLSAFHICHGSLCSLSSNGV